MIRLAEVPDAHVVLTVRADFYDELMASPLWPAIQRNRAEIAPLDEAGLREAIHKPAETVGVYVESALVERLAADAAGSPGVLPLVQETLVLLWEKLERRVLPLRSYESLILTRSAYDDPDGEGHRTGLEVAIARHAESVIASFADTPRAEIARRIFLRLIQFGEGRPNTRRQQTVAQLRAGHDPVEFAQVLKYLTDNRLLTQSGDEQTGRRKADIAHEALIVGWPRLRALDHRAPRRRGGPARARGEGLRLDRQGPRRRGLARLGRPAGGRPMARGARRPRPRRHRPDPRPDPGQPCRRSRRPNADARRRGSANSTTPRRSPMSGSDASIPPGVGPSRWVSRWFF